MIEIKEVDRRFYQDRLSGFLPPKVIDIHTHVWPAQHAQGDTTGRTASWPMRVAAVCPVEELLEMYRLMFPDKQVTPLIFGNPLVQGAIEKMNAYVAASAAANSLPALLLTRPEWPAEAVEEKIAQGRFLGAKVYLSYAPASIAPGQIRIFDFLPHHHLELFDRRGWIVMLHIPRLDRLRDPLNLADLLEITLVSETLNDSDTAELVAVIEGADFRPDHLVADADKVCWHDRDVDLVDALRELEYSSHESLLEAQAHLVTRQHAAQTRCVLRHFLVRGFPDGRIEMRSDQAIDHVVLFLVHSHDGIDVTFFAVANEDG